MQYYLFGLSSLSRHKVSLYNLVPDLQNRVKIEANCEKGKSQSTSLPTEKNMLVMDVKQQPVKQESVVKPIEAKPADIKTMPWNIKKQSSEPGISHGTDLQRTNNTTLMKKEWPLKNQQVVLFFIPIHPLCLS